MLDKLLDRRISVSMVLLALIVLGIIAARRLPVSLIPDVDIPFVTIQVNAPEMSARELDNSVVKPLRQSLVQIGHLKDIRSEAMDGSATMTLAFEEGGDIDYYFIEVNEKIDRAMGSLPRIERPKVFKASATDIPAFYINMTAREGAGDFLQMSEFAEDVISKRIEQLPEVAMVDISGTAVREILVIPDQEALVRLGISMEQFESAINSANIVLSNLTVRDGEYQYNVKFRSFAASREDIAGVWFTVGGRQLQIKDVAAVTEHEAPRSGLVRSDGAQAVILAVIKQGEARMSALRKGIGEQLVQFTKEYPQVAFTMTRDQTALLDYSIHNLLLNIILAIALVCVIVFLFMKDFRSPLLVSLTIPLSLVISVFVFYLIGLSINIISLSGLLLGVGMMVDNTIVLTDNITARWQKGEALRSAIVEGTREVRGAMLSSVLTTCAVFIPLVFLNGLAGELFYDQAVAVTTVLLVSYFATIAVLPVYYWALYRKLPAFRPHPMLERIASPASLRWYDRTVTRVLTHKWIAWALPLASLVIASICGLGMSREKLPPITYTDAILQVDWNEPVTLERSSERVRELEDLLEGRTEQSTAMIGVQQFVLRHAGDQSAGQASLYFRCGNVRELEQAKKGLLTHIGQHYPLAVASFSPAGNIFDMVFSEREPQLLARLRPTGSEGLTVPSLREFLGSLRRAMPEAHFDEPRLKQDVLYISDPERMSLYGVTMADLADVLRNALNGNRLFEIVRGPHSIPVVLGTDVREMEEILGAASVTVRSSAESIRLPVSALMRQTFEQDFKTLVSGGDGDYYPLELDIPSGQVRPAMATIREAARDDGHFDVSFSGAWFSNRDMIRQMILVLLVALALLFLILASQFESLIQPFIILSEIIIDIAFSLLGLWILGVSINIMSLIGLIVITGIVINDSILKIDTINRLVRQGCKVEEAIHEAGHRRLKAILMTSITTILAVVPFLGRGNMGADLQYPMALVIIFGMAIGTFVSLFYVPAVYAAIYKHRV